MATDSSFQAPIQESSIAAQDRVLIASRVLAVIIVPVLVAAFIILYLFSSDTGRLFAWPIKPPMTAMMLGATYLGGAYFFTRVAFAKKWHTVQLGFIPVTVFAGIMGITTILHWDKFSHGRFPFELWALLYFGLPFVIPVVWYLNQRSMFWGNSQSGEELFSRGLRIAIGLLGAVMVVSSAILLVYPQGMIPVWPWALTPLTARAMAAMFALPGLVGILVAMDGRWSSASIIFQAQALAILLFLVAILRTSDEIRWELWSAWAFLAGLLLVLILIGWASVQNSRRSSHSARAGADREG
jgi:hypothetical protein